MSTGALDGLVVVELRAKGPAPFAATLLADFGATVIRVDRPGGAAAEGPDPFGRGRRTVPLDLKSEDGRAELLCLVDDADVLIEAYRPGVAERLGIGPEECCARNDRLVYARMTGWGQEGPLAQHAGHDLNFLAIAGALHPLGSADRPPPPPLNLAGDFGGGALYLVVGILLALNERERSGRGQVVDAAMVDGVCNLMAAYHHLRARGEWTLEREANLVDGGAPFYRTYRCADGGFVAVGCLQPNMYGEFLRMMGLEPTDWPQADRELWPKLRDVLADQFAVESRSHWAARFEGSDACVTEVLDLDESTRAPHLAARDTFLTIDGELTPAPAPRLSRTPAQPAR